MTGIFEGIVVLELSQVFAGPLCARLLAEQGATVIKVERPGGDVSRQLPWRVNGKSGYFVQQNRGKLGVSVDLRSDDGVELLWRLIASADVLIDGFGPGVLAKFGFSYQTMSERNQRIIVCELSALGRGGSLGAARGYDQIGACYSGVAYTAGEGAALPSVALGDSAMGICAYAGIVSALYETRSSGRGQRVDVSLVDAYIQAHSNNLEAYALSGGTITAQPIQGQNATVCPSGAFQASDGRAMYIVALSNEEWVRICRCFGQPELASDPRFRSNEQRVAHRSEVLEIVNAWLQKQPSRESAIEQLSAAGVPAAPVLNIGEVVSHPHLLERGTVELIDDEDLGRFPVPGPPFKLSRTGREPLRPAPELGEHNAEVFQTYAQLSPAELEAFSTSGALVKAGDAPPNA